MAKVRVDLLLVERGLAESRALAQRLVMAGQVRVDGQIIQKPSQGVPSEALVVVDQGPPFVSRGGEKLQSALATFPVPVSGQVCADVGASTGGFTDCLLQNGAAKVYAIDVGHGILHWKLRQDPRVIIMERTNARYIEHLPEPVDLVTIDASFISLKILLSIVRNWYEILPPELTPDPNGDLQQRLYQPSLLQVGQEMRDGHLIALIKPQFEAGRKEVDRGDGVIRDPSIHRTVLLDILSYAREKGFAVRGLIRSPILGPKGNVEFLAWLDMRDMDEDQDLDSLISRALEP